MPSVKKYVAAPRVLRSRPTAQHGEDRQGRTGRDDSERRPGVDVAAEAQHGTEIGTRCRTAIGDFERPFVDAQDWVMEDSLPAGVCEEDDRPGRVRPIDPRAYGTVAVVSADLVLEPPAHSHGGSLITSGHGLHLPFLGRLRSRIEMGVVLFVCVENTFRRRVSEGVFNARAPQGWKAESAGAQAASAINPVAVELLKEIGVELGTKTPRTVTPEMIERASRVVTFGCLDRCPIGARAKAEDWPLPGATGKTWPELRVIRDELRRRIDDLIARFERGELAAPR